MRIPINGRLLASNLRRWRKERGINQIKLASMTSPAVKPSLIRYMEQGLANSVDEMDILAIARALNCRIPDLIGGDADRMGELTLRFSLRPGLSLSDEKIKAIEEIMRRVVNAVSDDPPKGD